MRQCAALDPVVYKLTNKVNGKGYVGKATAHYFRMLEHKRGKWSRGKLQYIDRAIQKHGWENFTWELLETNIDADALLDREGYWMEKCNTLVPHGYNVLPPGVGGVFTTDPVVRARWEVANRAGMLKGKETVQRKREEKLALLPSEQADTLRYYLNQKAEINRRARAGAEKPPDGRHLPSAKRQATWARKLEERLAKMSPEDAAKARAKHARSKRYNDAHPEKSRERHRLPKYKAYQKEYRAANKDKRALPKLTAETSG